MSSIVWLCNAKSTKIAHADELFAGEHGFIQPCVVLQIVVGNVVDTTQAKSPHNLLIKLIVLQLPRLFPGDRQLSLLTLYHHRAVANRFRIKNRNMKSRSPHPPKPRPLPPSLTVIQREPGSLHSRLIEEGRKMFEEKGASELSLRELARRVGVSEAAPSRHFKGKEELLAAIAVTGFEELVKVRARIAALEISPVKRAREMMTSYVRFARAHPGIFHLMTGPRLLEEFVRGDIEATSNVSYQYFSESIYNLARASGWPERQMELLAHAAWSMEHGLATLVLSGRAPRIDSKVDPEMMIDFAINSFLAAVASGPEAVKSALGHAKK